MTAKEGIAGSLKRHQKTAGSTRYPGSKVIYIFQALSTSEGTLPIQEMAKQMGLVIFPYFFLGGDCAHAHARTHTHTHTHTHTPFSLSPAQTGVRINSIKSFCCGKKWERNEVIGLQAVKGALS